jgi:hypothetical protein
MKFIPFIIFHLLFVINICFAQPSVNSEIWLADIRIKEASIYFGPAKNINSNKGYNSQPHFLNDSILLYTHIGQDLQADIYQYHLRIKNIGKFTDTKESEYSAKLMPSKKAISVVEVEKDSTQRIWSFDIYGKNGKVLVPQLDSVGYYTWLSDTSFAAFILTEPPSLQIGNIKSNKTTTIVKQLGRCIQTSSSGLLYFTMLEKDSARWLCRKEKNDSISKLIEFYKEVEDFVLSNNNIVFCAKGGIIYYSDENYNLGWRECGNFAVVGLNQINRLALSPDNKRMAIVNMIENKK